MISNQGNAYPLCTLCFSGHTTCIRLLFDSSFDQIMFIILFFVLKIELIALCYKIYANVIIVLYT
jgi:hypothetical protein